MGNSMKIIESIIHQVGDSVDDFFEARKNELLDEFIESLDLNGLENKIMLKSVACDDMTYWNWSSASKTGERINSVFERHPAFLDSIISKDKGQTGIKVLDLGCGFCSYWPFFEKLGVNSFVGIDLFDTRGIDKNSNTWTHSFFNMDALLYNLQDLSRELHGIKWTHEVNQDARIYCRDFVSIIDEIANTCMHQRNTAFSCCVEFKQSYHETTLEFVNKFLSKDSDTRILSGDTRNISNFLSKDDKKSFDYILVLHPGKAKPDAGTTGIPREIVGDICDVFLKDDGILVFDEN